MGNYRSIPLTSVRMEKDFKACDFLKASIWLSTKVKAILKTESAMLLHGAINSKLVIILAKILLSSLHSYRFALPLSPALACAVSTSAVPLPRGMLRRYACAWALSLA